ncbi:hypothetical protein V6C27_11110 [Peptococcaceae bacterium 1198_IL3148]
MKSGRSIILVLISLILLTACGQDQGIIEKLNKEHHITKINEEKFLSTVRKGNVEAVKLLLELGLMQF